jgi:hypothetical protein
MRFNIKTELQDAVKEFCGILGYNGTITVSDPYYPYEAPKEWSFPFPDEPGSYVFANAEGHKAYIGKGSRYMGNRIWAHIGRKKKEGELETYPDAEDFVKNNQPDIGVWAIAVPRVHWWLATALEGFLTEKFRPDIKRRN